MPKVTVTNLTASGLPINRYMNKVPANSTKNFDLTQQELDDSVDELTALADAGHIQWSVAATDSTSDDEAEGVKYSEAYVDSTTGGMSLGYVFRVPFAAGSAAASDDVTLFDASTPAPFPFRVLDVQLLVDTAGTAASTSQLRDATGGAGSAMSDDFDCASTGRKRDTGAAVTVTPTHAVGDTLVLRRSTNADSAGEVILVVQREA